MRRMVLWKESSEVPLFTVLKLKTWKIKYVRKDQAKNYRLAVQEFLVILNHYSWGAMFENYWSHVVNFFEMNSVDFLYLHHYNQTNYHLTKLITQEFWQTIYRTNLWNGGNESWDYCLSPGMKMMEIDAFFDRQ